MFPNINPTTTQAWKKLQEHFDEVSKNRMADYFKNDSNRYVNNSITLEDITVDYSKNNFNDQTKTLLLQLAEECKLKEARAAMFDGEKINQTEDRAVIHTALRNFSDNPMTVDGKDVMPEVREAREKMKSFCHKIHSGEWKGYSGKKIRNIVNICFI